MLFGACTPARVTATDPPPCVCPVIPAELLTCPPGSEQPEPTLRGLLEALTVERTAGGVCRARMREVRKLGNSVE